MDWNTEWVDLTLSSYTPLVASVGHQAPKLCRALLEAAKQVNKRLTGHYVESTSLPLARPLTSVVARLHVPQAHSRQEKMTKLAEREGASKQTKNKSPAGGRQVLVLEPRCLGAMSSPHSLGAICLFTNARVVLQLTRSGNPFLANSKVVCAGVWVISVGVIASLNCRPCA